MEKVLYYQHRRCGISTYTLNLVENVGSAHRGTFAPVAAAMQPDVSQKFSGLVTFVVHRARQSDYMVVADVEVNSNLDKGQLTGRTLAFAVGAGMAAVSIPYWAAKELLEDRRGLLVAFDDSRALGNAMAELIAGESQMAEIQSRVYACDMNTFWPKASKKYLDLLHTGTSSRSTTPRPQVHYRRRRMPGHRNSTLMWA